MLAVFFFWALVVQRNQMGSQTAIVILVLRVDHQKDQIETEKATHQLLFRKIDRNQTYLPREQSMRQLDILDNGLILVPLAVDWIRSGQNGSPRIQLADDASLGDRERLLFLKADSQFLSVIQEIREG